MKNSINSFLIAILVLFGCSSTEKDTKNELNELISSYPESNYLKQEYERVLTLKNDSTNSQPSSELNKIEVKGKWTTFMFRDDAYDGISTNSFIETSDKMYAIHMNPNSKLIGIEQDDNTIVMEFGTETQYGLYAEIIDIPIPNSDKEILSRLAAIQKEYIELIKSLNDRENVFIQSDSLNFINKYKDLFSENRYDTLFSISFLSQEFTILNNYLSSIQCANYSMANKKIVPVLVDSIVRID